MNRLGKNRGMTEHHSKALLEIGKMDMIARALVSMGWSKVEMFHICAIRCFLAFLDMFLGFLCFLSRFSIVLVVLLVSIPKK